ISVSRFDCLEKLIFSLKVFDEEIFTLHQPVKYFYPWNKHDNSAACTPMPSLNNNFLFSFFSSKSRGAITTQRSKTKWVLGSFIFVKWQRLSQLWFFKLW